MSSKVVIEIRQRIEQEVKELFEAKAIRWDPHALMELDNDNITTEEVKVAINSIQLIEVYWTYGFHSLKCVFYIDIPGKPHTHLVLMLSDKNVYIKTGYIASDTKKFKSDGKTRVRDFD